MRDMFTSGAALLLVIYVMAIVSIPLAMVTSPPLPKAKHPTEVTSEDEKKAIINSFEQPLDTGIYLPYPNDLTTKGEDIPDDVYMTVMIAVQARYVDSTTLALLFKPDYYTAEEYIYDFSIKFNITSQRGFSEDVSTLLLGTISLSRSTFDKKEELSTFPFVELPIYDEYRVEALINVRYSQCPPPSSSESLTSFGQFHLGTKTFIPTNFRLRSLEFHLEKPDSLAKNREMTANIGGVNDIQQIVVYCTPQEAQISDTGYWDYEISYMFPDDRDKSSLHFIYVIGYLIMVIALPWALVFIAVVITLVTVPKYERDFRIRDDDVYISVISWFAMLTLGFVVIALYCYWVPRLFLP